MSAGPTSRTSEPSNASSPSRGAPAWMLPLLLVATLAPLVPLVRGGFVWDDLDRVARNPRIASLARLPEIFAHPTWDLSGASAGTHVGYWRPLAEVVLAIGHALGGGAPAGYHWLSLALHLAATAAAFRLALRLTKSAPIAFFGALLFGLHPVHVESVAWISAINDPLFGLFALLSIDSFVAWRDRGSSGWAWKCALYFFLALLSKELALSLVPIVLAIDYARSRAGGEVWSSWKRAYSPLAAAIFIVYAARVAVYRDALAGFEYAAIDFGVGTQRLALLRVELLGGFLGLLAWPMRLELFRAVQPSLALTDPIILRALAFIAAWIALIAWTRSRRSFAALAAALFVPAALLLLFVHVEALGRFPLSDRYLYLAVLGFTLLVALAAFRALPARIACALLALVALVYGVRSLEQTAYWRDEETLLTRAAVRNPKNPLVQVSLGRLLLEKYRHEKIGDTLGRAHDAFERALELLSAAQGGDQTIFATVEDHVQANLGYGWTFLYEAEVDEIHDYKLATEVFKRVADRYPLSAEAWTSLGVAYSQMGDEAQSKKDFEKALELEPNHAEAYRGLGVLALRGGRAKDAVASLEKALELRPDSLEDALLLAGALGDGGDTANAMSVAERAREKHPEDAGPLAMLGTLAAQKGDIESASKYADRALALSPDDGKSLLLKGKIQLSRAEFTGALRTLQRAADLLPTSFEAHYDVAALYLRDHKFHEALPYLFRAYDCRPLNASGDLLHTTLLSMDLQDVDTLLKLAAIDAQHDRDKDASEWVERALAIKPDDGAAHFLKGTLAKKHGDLQAAADEWRKSCAAMPDNPAANEALGMVLVEMKRPDEALGHLEKALAIAAQTPTSDELQLGARQMLRETIDRIKSGKH